MTGALPPSPTLPSFCPLLGPVPVPAWLRVWLPVPVWGALPVPVPAPAAVAPAPVPEVATPTPVVEAKIKKPSKPKPATTKKPNHDDIIDVFGKDKP